MGRGSISGLDVDVVLRQDHIKQLDGLQPAFFSPILESSPFTFLWIVCNMVYSPLGRPVATPAEARKILQL
jgi:hypothetical protein